MKSRRKFTASFKSKVSIEAIKEQSSIAQLAEKYQLHPTQINTWKKEFLANSSKVFEKEKDKKTNTSSVEEEKLYSKIGQLQMENDFLKKALS